MHTFSTLRRASLVLVGTLLAACSTGESGRTAGSGSGDAGSAKAAWAPANLTAVKGVPIAALRTAIAARLSGTRPAAIGEDAWRHTQRLYARYQQSPLWLNADGLATDRAGDLTQAVLNANADALALDDYPIADLATAIAAVRRAGSPTAAQLADADVLLTATYASLGEDLLSGQVDPKTVSQAWHIDAKDENVDSALVRTLSQMPLGAAINAMRPQDAEYAALAKELVRFRGIVAKGDWPRVPAGKPLKPGESDAPQRLAALRARLAAEGIAVPAAAAGARAYDAGLAGAVAEFQRRHGIAVDSSLGAETVASLNVPVAYRLGQIAANMERHRWMPRALPDRYIHVNVPAFQLTAFDRGKPTLEMKVIVGQEYADKATPVFADSMETVVFRPYWNITPDIQASEIEPKIASDPGYMAAENLEYYSDGGTRRIRQKPGPRNSLGFVKFLFPNDFNIYLHDTPNHELFQKDVRAFSHGCIRVEKPNELAQWVLGWDANRVQQAMAAGPDNSPVKVPKKIPVFISYATAYVRDGQLFFGNDLYHRDDKLVQAIATGALPSARAVQAVEALKRIATG
ncbi:MAG: ErfK/YbiS/YcfS/YnhG family protein [Gemmatimonadetes bacterium]|jgi:murein L,D-transpeptidase YcbB/YkuD|nr:ErfK/YbiS/YcfS/YnhG family protein [Gemmatimonadota bacterium]